MKRYFFSLLVISGLLLCGAVSAHAQTPLSGTGFVSNPIWYSKDPFAEGDTIKIFTVLFNTSGETLRGTVSFFDESAKLGATQFSLPANEVKDFSIEWKVTAGHHKIHAQIENATLLSQDGTSKAVTLANTDTPTSERDAQKQTTNATSSTLAAGIIESALESEPALAVTRAVGDAIVTAEDKLPVVVATPLKNTLAAAENTRLTTKADLARSIAGTNATTTFESLTHSPFATIWLFLLLTFHTILSYPLLTYGFFFFVIFLIIGKIRRRIRGF